MTDPKIYIVLADNLSDIDISNPNINFVDVRGLSSDQQRMRVEELISNLDKSLKYFDSLSPIFREKLGEKALQILYYEIFSKNNAHALEFLSDFPNFPEFHPEFFEEYSKKLVIDPKYLQDLRGLINAARISEFCRIHSMPKDIFDDLLQAVKNPDDFDDALSYLGLYDGENVIVDGFLIPDFWTQLTGDMGSSSSKSKTLSPSLDVEDAKNDCCSHSPTPDLQARNRSTAVVSTTTPDYQPRTRSRSRSPVLHEITYPPLPELKASQQLGVIGENEVLEYLKRHFQSGFDVERISNVGHSGDIHLTCEEKKIKFLIEVKNKTQIVKDDVEKFEKDIKTVSGQYVGYRIVGLFISIRARIPGCGAYGVGYDRIWLAEEYASESSVILAINLFLRYASMMTGGRVEEPARSVRYEISENVINLVAQIRAERHSLDREREICNNQIIRQKESMVEMQELLHGLDLREQFFNFLDMEFDKVIPQAGEAVRNRRRQEAENELRNLLANSPKSKIKVGDIRSLYGEFIPEVMTHTKDWIFQEYGPRKE